MTNEKLNDILENHKLWLSGNGGTPADLRDANLTGANLTGADLTGANLRDAILRGADLTGANLTGANLTDANLTYASLTGADLRDAILRGADLTGADLRDADLMDAILTGADLTGANLTGANLTDASLWRTRGNGRQIKSMAVVADYAITYTAEVLQIGCEQHAISAWWLFDDARIKKMDGKKAIKFWAEWRDTIKMIIEKSPATK